MIEQSIQQKPYPLSSLLLMIIIEGFVTISVEILAIRQLIPFVGNNVIVTSLIIGVFLLFLAVGYRRGGTITDNYLNKLIINFSISLLFIGVGMSYVVAEQFFQWFRHGLQLPMLLVLNIYLLLIVAPTVYLLGQTVPISTNLFRQDARVGEINGIVLSVSTMGSFLGAVLTSVLLLSYFGVAWTIVINCLALYILIASLMPYGQRSIFTMIALGLALCGIYGLNIDFEKHTFIHTNQYSNYRVVEDFQLIGEKHGSALMINNSVSSFLRKNNKAAPYIELIKKRLFHDLALHDKSILALGAGGFTLSAEGEFGNHFTYVDIDKDIYPLVKKHYQKNIKGNFIHADARVYLQYKKQHFDVIINDVYKSYHAIPAYLLTAEYMTLVKQAIKPNGFAVFNIIANPMFNDTYSARVDNTINTVFKHCSKQPMHYANQYDNVIYICPVLDSANDDTIYTDNRTTASLDFYRLN